MSATPAEPGRPAGPRPWRDVAFLTVLLGLAAVPLVALRGHPLFFTPRFQFGLWGAWLAVAAAWAWFARRTVTRGVGGWAVWVRWAAYAAVLFAVSVVAFDKPLRQHFWGGCDEVTNFYAPACKIWCDGWDHYGRPLTGVARWAASVEALI